MADVILNGKPFPLRDEPPKQGRIMVLARAEKRGDVAVMAAYLDFLEAMLADHDPDEFETAISEMDAEDVKDALHQAAESYRQDPSSAARTSSSPSAGGSPDGKPTSKVVSLSQGTVRWEEAS